MRFLKIFLLVSFLLAGGFSANFVFAAEKIDIDTAPLEDLIKIIHIGEIRASELISLRPFSSLDDLTRIKGIGEKRVEDIKKQGLAWVDAQKEPQPKPQPGTIEDILPLTEPEPEPEVTSTPTETLPIIYPLGIVINEILPYSEGPDAEEEWIEIFNQNIFEVDLSDWQIADTTGSTKTYIFPKKTKIGPREFLVLSRLTTKITLNNSGDGLNLIRPDEEIVYTINYNKAPQGESFNRTEPEWVWSETLTPGSANIIPVPEEPESQEETKETGGTKPQQVAVAGEQLPESSGSSIIIIMAIGLAIFSGTIILILKRKIKTGKIQ